MRVGIRAKLFLASLSLLVLCLAASETYLLPAVDADLTERIRKDLLIRLKLVAERAAGEAGRQGEPYGSWDAFADKLGTLANARVTFVRSDGHVLGDSQVQEGDIERLENHRARPEVAAAIEGRVADVVRYSATTQTRMMYAAAPIPGSGDAIARVSLPLAWVDAAKRRTRALVWGAAGVALAAALVLSWIAAVLLSSRLRSLTAVARRLAAGQLDVRSHVDAPDEIGELGRTLDLLAGNLSVSLRDLRNDRDLLGRILESMREGVLVTDGDHRVLLANASLREMLLLSSDVVGRSTIEVIRNAQLQSLVERALSGDDSVEGEIEVSGIKPRRLLVHGARLSGEPRALLLVLFDVTEMRRLETIRRDFVANVSHELRTPVASVQSAAETLREAWSNDPEAAEQFIDMIERNARRLADLITDLLELARLEAGGFQLRSEALDVRALCERAVLAVHERASLRGLQLSVDIPAGLPRAVGDERGFDRALSNLVDNAIKYVPDGSTIVVGARIDEDRIRISVTDNGPGIDARHLPRLFERFYRVDPGRSREMGGTGLGLSIVKHLVEAMGGEVGVESTVGHGSTFFFYLRQSP